MARKLFSEPVQFYDYLDNNHRSEAKVPHHRFALLIYQLNAIYHITTVCEVSICLYLLPGCYVCCRTVGLTPAAMKAATRELKRLNNMPQQMPEHAMIR